MFVTSSVSKSRQTAGLRIAVILSGELRTLDYCLPKLAKSFSGPHETHFFLSTWDQNRPASVVGSKNIFIRGIESPEKLVAETINSQTVKFTGSTIEKYDIITQKHLHIAEEVSFNIPLQIKDRAFEYATCAHAIMVTLNQWYLLKKGFELVQNFQKNEKYDIIVRARPDIILAKPVIWPKLGEIFSDCLRLSRRRKHFLFDGYFVGSYVDMAPILNGYDYFLEILALKEFFPIYTSKMKIQWALGKTVHRRTMGSKGRRSILESEHFYRYLLAQQKNCTIIDSRVHAEMVRSR